MADWLAQLLLNGQVPPELQGLGSLLGAMRRPPGAYQRGSGLPSLPGMPSLPAESDPTVAGAAPGTFPSMSLPSLPSLMPSASPAPQRPAGPRAPDAPSPMPSISTLLSGLGLAVGSQGGSEPSGAVDAGALPGVAQGLGQFFLPKIFPPSTATPGKPGAPASSPGALAPTLPGGAPGSIPMVNTRPQTGGRNEPLVVEGSPLPEPPMIDLTKVPQLGKVGGADFSRARKLAEEGRPTGPDKEKENSAALSAVLGGLAQGAAGVSATEPGSFAKALAAAGGGGATARASETEKSLARAEQFDERKQRYGLARSQQEVEMARTQAELANAQRQTDFQNAKLIYDAQIANQSTAANFALQKAQMAQPKMHSSADGITVETTAPDGKTTFNFVNTKPHYEHLEGIGKTFAGLGLDPSVPQMQFITQSGLPPQAQQHLAQGLAIKGIIDKGYGAQTFGEEYKKAVTQVEGSMKGTEWDMLRATKPEVYIAEKNKRIANTLHNNFTNSGDQTWVGQLAKTADPWLLPHIVGGAQQPPPISQPGFESGNF